MSIKYVAIIVVVLLGISMAGQDSFAFMKRKDKRTVYEVPTTGRIIDVKYHPEFDEWWVHCREGDNIAVYTYDHRNQTWAKVLFTPKKADEKAQRIEKLDKVKPAGDADTATHKEEQKIEQPQPEPRKELDKTPKKTDKKWWDPLNLLQGQERPKPEGK